MNEIINIDTDNTCILSPLELTIIKEGLDFHIKQSGRWTQSRKKKMWEKYLKVTFAKIEELNKLAIEAAIEYGDDK